METVVLANHIKRTVRGPMWHGPSLDEVLKDVTPELAAARPVPGAHTIWELVLHVTAWAEISDARLRGERLADPAPEEDWPPVRVTDQAAWEETLARLRESHRTLAHSARHLDASQMHEKMPGLEYSRSNLLHGVIEHGTYHGGQIALLKRCARLLPGEQSPAG